MEYSSSCKLFILNKIEQSQSFVISHNHFFSCCYKLELSFIDNNGHNNTDIKKRIDTV